MRPIRRPTRPAVWTGAPGKCRTRRQSGAAKPAGKAGAIACDPAPGRRAREGRRRRWLPISAAGSAYRKTGRGRRPHHQARPGEPGKARPRTPVAGVARNAPHFFARGGGTGFRVQGVFATDAQIQREIPCQFPVVLREKVQAPAGMAGGVITGLLHQVDVLRRWPAVGRVEIAAHRRHVAGNCGRRVQSVPAGRAAASALRGGPSTPRRAWRLESDTGPAPVPDGAGRPCLEEISPPCLRPIRQMDAVSLPAPRNPFGSSMAQQLPLTAEPLGSGPPPPVARFPGLASRRGLTALR